MQTKTYIKPSQTITGPSGYLKSKPGYIFSKNGCLPTFIPVDSNTKSIKIDESDDGYNLNKRTTFETLYPENGLI